MNLIEKNIQEIKNDQPDHDFTLIAVSKTKPKSDIEEAYHAGHRHFGENKVQELVDKHESLPKDITWHMIGHLQRNKVKYIVPFVHLIHGIDSQKLLQQVNKEGQKINRVIKCLLQVHIAQEESKFGFSEEELKTLLNSEAFKNLAYIKVIGLMGMATNTDDQTIIQKEFNGLKSLYDELSLTHFFTTLSMGMSGDYKIALEAGSNMIRVGSAIFGARNYEK